MLWSLKPGNIWVRAPWPQLNKLVMKIEDFYNAPRHAGIYMFRNLLNGKCYIGQAEKLRKRLLHHLSNLKNERYDAPIYKALKKYGLENFELKILQTFHDALGSRTKQLLDYWEIKYIDEFNTLRPNGYNITPGGCTSYITRQRKIVQISKHGEIIKICESKISDKEKGKPGEIIDATKEGITVMCKDKSIIITKLKPSGKKEMTAKDYLNGKNKENLVGEILC